MVVGGIGPGWRTAPLVPCLRRVSPLSSRGLGRRPLTAETGVRIPVAVLTERPYHGRSRPSGSRQPCSPVGSGRTFEPIPAFADSYAAERARSARQGSLGALLVLDCDRFKALNDRHGHVAGDLALCRLAEVVRAYIREGDTAARLGGDEFAVLLSAPDAGAAAMIGSRIQRAFAGVEGTPPPTLSIGIVELPADGEVDLNTALAAADRAMYRAKSQGGNRVCVGALHDGLANLPSLMPPPAVAAR